MVMIRTGVAGVGTFDYPIRLYSPDGVRSEPLNPLVDTGSLFTWAPAVVLERLAIAPEQEIPFELANGQRVSRPTAEVLVEIDGVKHSTVVVFGQPGDFTLLGAYTLERFLLMPDVVNRRLVPIVATVA